MRGALAALVLLCAGVLLVGLADTGFLDTREARDAVVAREIAGARDVLTPMLGSEPWLEKPLLAYGPDAAVQVLSRHPELDSRLYRAVVALLLIALTGSVAAMHFGAEAGAFSALVLVTTLALPNAARTDGTILLATLLSWLGLAGFADAVFFRRSGIQTRLMLTYAALGLALVTGGPLLAAWPFGALALYAALGKRRELWSRIRVWPGVGIMLGLALPWYGAMTVLHAGRFWRHVAFFPYAAEPRGPLLAGPLVLLSFLVIEAFPWSALLPGALLHAATWWRVGGASPLLTRARESREENAAHFFIAALVAALAPIVVWPTPPLTSMLPAAPAVALLCGRLLAHASEDQERVAAPIGRGALMLALVGSMSAVLMAVAAGTLRDAAAPLRLLGTVLFITSWLPFLAHLTRRHLLAALLLALPVAIGAPLVTTQVLPALEDTLSARSVARALERVAPPTAALVLVDPPPPSLRFYGEHNLVVAPEIARALAPQRAADGLTYLAFRPAREREVARAIAAPLEVLLRTPVLVLARVRV